LDRDLAQAHIALAAQSIFHDRDWPAADAELKSRVALDPNSVDRRAAGPNPSAALKIFVEDDGVAQRSIRIQCVPRNDAHLGPSRLSVQRFRRIAAFRVERQQREAGGLGAACDLPHGTTVESAKEWWRACIASAAVVLLTRRARRQGLGAMLSSS
jgi:hypothetical protein